MLFLKWVQQHLVVFYPYFKKKDSPEMMDAKPCRRTKGPSELSGEWTRCVPKAEGLSWMALIPFLTCEIVHLNKHYCGATEVLNAKIFEKNE